MSVFGVLCKSLSATGIGFFYAPSSQGAMLWRIMQIDYYAYRSGMKTWNAGIKIGLSLVTLGFVLVLNHVTVSLFIIVTMTSLTLAKGKVPIRVYVSWVLIPLAFMLVNAGMIGTWFSKEVTGAWNISLYVCFLCASKESLVQALEVFLKGLAGISTIYMMAFSTPMSDIISVFRKLHLPEILLELMYLMYRYIFMLLETQKQMQMAAKSRMGYRTLAQSFRSFAKIGGSLLMVSMRRASTYYDALLARGYDGRIEFLTEEKPIKPLHIIGVMLYFASIFMVFFVGGR